MGHDAVLTPLGVCDGDRWGQTLLREFPTSQPSELCSLRTRRFMMSPSSDCFRSVSARTTPWQERGEEGRGFKAHFGCQRSEQRTPNRVGVTLGRSQVTLLGEACQDVLTALQSVLLELGANPSSSSVRAGEKGMRAEPCPAAGSSPGVFPQAVSKLTVTPSNSHRFLSSAEVQGGVGGVFKSKTQDCEPL